MTVFFGILITLILFNILLLAFSSNRVKTRTDKKAKKISQGSIAKAITPQLSGSEYKEAV